MKNDQFFMKLCDKKDDFPFLLREYSAQEEIFHLKMFSAYESEVFRTAKAINFFKECKKVNCNNV